MRQKYEATSWEQTFVCFENLLMMSGLVEKLFGFSFVKNSVKYVLPFWSGCFFCVGYIENDAS